MSFTCQEEFEAAMGYEAVMAAEGEAHAEAEAAAAEEVISKEVITTDDGYHVDPETGEIVGFVPPEPGFEVKDKDSAEWVLGKLLDARAAAASGTELELAALRRYESFIHDAIDEARNTPEGRAAIARMENAADIRARACRRANWLEQRFEGELKAFASSALEGQRERSLYMPSGTLSLRKKAARLVVEDEDEAVEALIKCGQKCAIKQTVQVSKIEPAFREVMLKNGAAGFVVEPETQVLTIKTGAESSKEGK